MRTAVLVAVSLLASGLASPGSNPAQPSIAAHSQRLHGDLSEQQRAETWRTLHANVARLRAAGRLPGATPKAIPAFGWPLRLAAGRGEIGYYVISSRVDQDLSSSGTLDYHCGFRTYPGHTGTDIYTWPFPWKKMHDEDVVVVAGAPGVIIHKADGFDDEGRCQSTLADQWNAVYVRHADGSIAWYGHLKNGSPTVKAAGEAVAQGEYLGVVSSSGISSSPHLHVELYDPSGRLVDPFSGACDGLSNHISWAQEPLYLDPGVLALTVSDAQPNPNICPAPEQPHATDHVQPGTTAFFTASIRDQTPSTPLTLRILRPDGSEFAADTRGNAQISMGDWQWRHEDFPAILGTWTFEAAIAGKTYRRPFQVGGEPAYGPPAALAVLPGSAQSTAAGTPFTAPIRINVTDVQGRAVKGAMVRFTLPATGPTAVLESRNALTDASGTASVAAIANARAGAYDLTAGVDGIGGTVSVRLENTAPSALSASPPEIRFGGQSLNTTSPARSVTLTNVGGQPLAISSVTVGTYFSRSHNCEVLAPGASCMALVSFTPGLAEELAGVLDVASDAGRLVVPLHGTGERSLVTHYYQSILRRAPDDAGKTFWHGEAARMAAIGANVNETWNAMAMAFYFSPEYAAFNRDDGGFVTDLYRTFFNRAPDRGGFAHWTEQAREGLPREVMLPAFMFSTEFTAFTRAIFGDVPVRAEIDMVTDFYRGYLARLPDSGGFGFWIDRFRAAQCAGASAVHVEADGISGAFATSSEYAARNRSNAQHVGDLYNAFLRRGGDLEGVRFWIGELDRGARSRAQVGREFIASPEFASRVERTVSEGCVR